jgi:hypothetical protein
LCVFIFIQIKSKDKTVKMIVNKDDCRKKNALKSDEEKSKKINELMTCNFTFFVCLLF